MLMGSGATQQSCNQAAEAGGYQYFALQDGGQCFADNSYGA